MTQDPNRREKRIRWMHLSPNPALARQRRLLARTHGERSPCTAPPGPEAMSPPRRSIHIAAWKRGSAARGPHSETAARLGPQKPAAGRPSRLASILHRAGHSELVALLVRASGPGPG
jgi:hypothetical protein